MPWPRLADDAPGHVKHADDAAADRAMYMAERFSEMNARAYKDAYTLVGQLMAATLEAQGNALTAIANRAIGQEETIAGLQEQVTELLKSRTTSQGDELMGKVIDAALTNAGKPGGKNGTA